MGATGILGILVVLALVLLAIWDAYRSPGWSSRAPGCCSFCGKNYKEAGPLMEGPNQVYVCLNCCRLAQSLIEAENERLSQKPAKPEEP